MSGKGPMKRKNPPSQEEDSLQCILDMCRQMGEIASGLLLAVTAAEERAKAAEEGAKAAAEGAKAAEKRAKAAEEQIRVQRQYIESLEACLSRKP